MEFIDHSLQQVEKTDPLWLYKVGVSLIKKEAEKQTRESRSKYPLAIEAHAAASKIQQYFDGAKETRYLQETALDPLINIITDQWCAFSDVFGLYSRHQEANDMHQWSERDRRQIYAQVKEDILSAFHDLSLLTHLARVKDASDIQIEQLAQPIMDRLNKWGANGWSPMWQHYSPEPDLKNNKFFQRLINDERPIFFVAYGTNPSFEPPSRKSTYKLKMHGYSSEGTQENVARYHKRLLEIIPEIIGPQFVKDMEKTESLIRTNVIIPAQKPESHGKATFQYVDKDLNLTPEELANIRLGNNPQTANEYLDAAFIGNHRGSSAEVIAALVKKIRYRPIIGKESATKRQSSESLKPNLSGEEFLDALGAWVSGTSGQSAAEFLDDVVARTYESVGPEKDITPVPSALSAPLEERGDTSAVLWEALPPPTAPVEDTASAKPDGAADEKPIPAAKPIIDVVEQPTDSTQSDATIVLKDKPIDVSPTSATDRLSPTSPMPADTSGEHPLVVSDTGKSGIGQTKDKSETAHRDHDSNVEDASILRERSAGAEGDDAKKGGVGAKMATLGGAAAALGILLSSRNKSGSSSRDQESSSKQHKEYDDESSSIGKKLAFAAAITVSVGGAIAWSRKPEFLYKPLKKFLDLFGSAGGKGV